MDLTELQSFLPIHHGNRIWKLFMEHYHCDTICELGVQRGANFKRMIEHNPKLAVAVDCWIDNGKAETNDTSLFQDGLDKQYETFRDEMKDKPFVKICRGYTYDVVKQFSDEFFDLVYIDADHTYNGVRRDINDWYPKVKKGGFLLGHDYRGMSVRVRQGKITFGVKMAVNQFVRDNNITTFFTVYPHVWGLVK
jgi:hypothetical protein